MKLSVIVPVYNEKDTILEVVEAIKKAPAFDLDKEIILVDDFSTDGTKNRLKDLKIENLKILYNEKNMGKGYSVRRGMAEVSSDFIIIQDADFEYNPAEYEKLLAPLVAGEADVIYGSRFKNSKFIFSAYYIANKFLTFLSNLFTGLSLTDMETCYKCFTREALNKILPHLKANRFEIEPEITAVAAKLDLKIKEVPISYSRRSYAQGKKIGWKDGLQAIIAIVKYSL
ncbi:MAG: glycosyltransferase family 2 protein [Patescibacteria group bacterium]